MSVSFLPDDTIKLRAWPIPHCLYFSQNLSQWKKNFSIFVPMRYDHILLIFHLGHCRYLILVKLMDIYCVIYFFSSLFLVKKTSSSPIKEKYSDAEGSPA